MQAGDAAVDTMSVAYGARMFTSPHHAELVDDRFGVLCGRFSRELYVSLLTPEAATVSVS